MKDRTTHPRPGSPLDSALPTALAAAGLAALPFLAGCNVALVGNLFVVMVTVGIFFGTLGLGRTSSQRTATRSSDRSTSESSRS